MARPLPRKNRRRSIPLKRGELLEKAGWKPITQHEWVVFIGIIHAARHFNQLEKELWTSEATRVREAPDFERFMKSYHFKLIRQMIMYSKADLSASQIDPWAMFRHMFNDFNNNRATALQPGMTQTLDESMCSYKPRKDKRGGLPNIFFILRKPKPLGKEFKTMCDADTGLMTWVEVQEGRTAMRHKAFSREIVSTRIPLPS
jgi:hypothetical protein